MLQTIQPRQKFSLRSVITTVVVVLLLASGLYLLLLVMAPSIPYIYKPAPLDVATIEKPVVGVNRIMIPKIGVDIPYGTDEKTSLDKGALWRHSDRGNPEDGGNFIIAAHRFSIQPTPRGTVIKSPFFHLDKLVKGDQIIVDYEGKRYGYEVTKSYDVKPSQIEIEAPSTTPKLTLYSCELGGAEAGRIVFEAKPVGQITLKKHPSSS